MDWRALAKCRDMDPQIFFPDEGVGTRADWETSRKVCAVCQVRDACLDSAMREEQGTGRDVRSGMRGGLTPKERYAYARGRRPPVPMESRQDARRRRKFEEHEAAIRREKVKNERWRHQKLRAGLG